MAYRRRQGSMSRSSTFKEEKNHLPPDEGEWPASPATSSLAAQPSSATHHSKGGPTYDYTSMGSSNETGSFWGVLARKAKAILEDDTINSSGTHSPDHLHHHHLPLTPKRLGSPSPSSPSPRAASHHLHQIDHSISKKLDSPTPNSTLACSMRDSIGKTLEEGLITPPRNKQQHSAGSGSAESRNKIQIVRKGMTNNEVTCGGGGEQQQYNKSTQIKNPTTQEDQLKASRDVAMATAAKAKLLLRELKTVKADLTFAKQRCSQLEEENRILRDAREKGANPADDDMIRNQLETLLAEKARLAHENSVYARENRVLREIVEYHQLTMQDVIYLDEEEDEGSDEVPEAYPIFSASLPDSPTSPPHEFISLFRSASATAQLRFDPHSSSSPPPASSKTKTSSSIPRPSRDHHF